MPAGGVISVTSKAVINATTAQVYVNDQLRNDIFCMAAEQSTGLKPGVALLQFGSSEYTANAPLTLGDFDFQVKQWDRVDIYASGSLIFSGPLVKRRDICNPDSIMWEAWDCRIYLQYLHMRGCFCWDDYSSSIKFISRYPPRTNPKGFFNCIGVSYGGGVIPIFTSSAWFKRTYQSPDDVFSSTLSAGKVTAWTPRRFLQYLHFISHVSIGDIPGTSHPWWRSISAATGIVWDDTSLNLVGRDAGSSEVDPLDSKMPDIQYRGETVLSAINKTLQVAGTHKMRVEGRRIEFYPTFISGRRESDTDLEIPFRRSGDATDANTAFDFTFEEDATQVVKSALTEGGPIRIESRFTTAAGQIKPVFSSAIQTAFIDAIRGNGTFAFYPSSQFNPTVVDLVADGAGGRPLFNANTKEAVDWLRANFYPHPFKNYTIDSSTALSILAGVSGVYSDADKYPLLSRHGRPVMPEQLQFYRADIAGLDGDRIPRNFPIKFEVLNGSDWIAVPFNIGLRLDGDGSFWIDGLAEDADGQNYCLYSGSLYSTDTITARPWRMNCAVAHDYRLAGYVYSTEGSADISEDLQAQIGGPPMAYVDSPEAYQELHQVNSYPADFEKFSGGPDGNQEFNLPLNRYLPPGSEIDHAEYAARRIMARNEYVKKRTAWRMIGIRPEYYAGAWVAAIKDPSGSLYLRIDAPIENVTFDFMNQTTHIGGLISELGTGTGEPNVRPPLDPQTEGGKVEGGGALDYFGRRRQPLPFDLRGSGEDAGGEGGAEGVQAEQGGEGSGAGVQFESSGLGNYKQVKLPDGSIEWRPNSIFQRMMRGEEVFDE